MSIFNKRSNESLLQWIWTLLLLSSFILIPLSTEAANFSFERESIVTVCDIYRINITSKGQPIPHCDELPPPGDFFNVSSRTVWEMPCDDTSNDEPVARRPTIWDRTIRALHWLLEGVQNKIKALGVILLGAIQDVTRLSLISKRWDGYWYLVGALSASLFFFIQGLYLSRPGKLGYNIILNVFMGFGSTAVYYMIHLYFRNVFVMAVFAVIGVFAFTPWYVKIRMSAMGVLTSMELLIPLFGFCIMNIFETQLFFGPILSLFINGGSIVIHILCLTALYIDEKLILVKVFLLPFYRMFQKVFGLSDKNQKEIDFMRANAHKLNNEIFTTFGEAPPPQMSTLEMLDRFFTQALVNACKKRQGRWQDECWYFVRDRCSDETWNLGAISYIIGWVLCPKVAYKSCDPVGKINLDEFCASPTNTAFGAAFDGYQKAIEQLGREIVVDPLKPKVNNDILEMTAGFDLFAAKWTWWLRHFISWGLAGLALALLLISIIYAIVFLVKYRRNLYFCNNYLDSSLIDRWKINLSRREKGRYYSTFSRAMFDYAYIIINYPSRFAESLRLLSKVMLCFWIEQSAKYLHHQLMNIQFVVPEYGDARFVFNVQGDGTIAAIMRAILGGFSLQSKYCKIADSSVCDTAFIPVKWQTWLMLFCLAFFYFLIGIYQSKSDYIMCRICDFLIPEQGEKRAEVILKDVMEERRKRAVIVQALAEEEYRNPCVLREQNPKILSFYRPRRWYQRFLPNIALSAIANLTIGVDNILCQVCHQDIITARFACKVLLFCDECRVHLSECPCKSDECQDGEIFDV